MVTYQEPMQPGDDGAFEAAGDRDAEHSYEEHGSPRVMDLVSLRPGPCAHTPQHSHSRHIPSTPILPLIHTPSFVPPILTHTYRSAAAIHVPTTR